MLFTNAVPERGLLISRVNNPRNCAHPDLKGRLSHNVVPL